MQNYGWWRDEVYQEHWTGKSGREGWTEGERAMEEKWERERWRENERGERESVYVELWGDHFKLLCRCYEISTHFWRKLFQTPNWPSRSIRMPNLSSWYVKVMCCHVIVTWFPTSGILPQSEGDGWWRVRSSRKSAVTGENVKIHIFDLFLELWSASQSSVDRELWVQNVSPMSSCCKDTVHQVEIWCVSQVTAAW